MNPHEQNIRRTAIAELRAEFKQLEEACATMMEEGFVLYVARTKVQIEAVVAAMDTRAETTETKHAKLVRVIETKLVLNGERLTEPLRRDFIGRFRWLVLGR
jgi:hypothetical protein